MICRWNWKLSCVVLWLLFVFVVIVLSVCCSVVRLVLFVCCVVRFVYLFLRLMCNFSIVSMLCSVVIVVGLMLSVWWCDGFSMKLLMLWCVLMRLFVCICEIVLCMIVWFMFCVVMILVLVGSLLLGCSVLFLICVVSVLMIFCVRLCV